jgi:RNA polymerase sigma-70 factor (ECF subfamily)
METSNEIELIKRLQQSDSEAFLALYDRYHVIVYNWSLKIVKVPTHAEDIVQDVFLKIWQIRDRLNPHQSFPAFIYRICRNKAFTLIKKITTDERLQIQIMHQLKNVVESTENSTLWHEYEVLLSNAVGKLPKQRQKVFKLCRQEGKSYEEVANELGISRNTVKEHMVMAVKNIKEYFYQYGDISFLLILLSSSHFK